jgi:hypothetical protein
MSVQVGIVLEVNNKEVPLIPKKAMQDIKKHGMELELNERLNLGPISGDIDYIVKKFDNDFSITKVTDNLPDVLDKVVDKLLGLELIIEEFKLVIPGTATPIPQGAPKAPTLYTLGMSFMWSTDPLELVTDTLAVKGLYLKVSNETEGGTSAGSGSKPAPAKK